jgi:hypothetical protein
MRGTSSTRPCCIPFWHGASERNYAEFCKRIGIWVRWHLSAPEKNHGKPSVSG